MSVLIANPARKSINWPASLRFPHMAKTEVLFSDHLLNRLTLRRFRYFLFSSYDAQSRFFPFISQQVAITARQL